MTEVERVLMRRDGYSREEAADALAEARDEVNEWAATGEGRDPEEILYEDFGLEPDYIFDLML